VYDFEAPASPRGFSLSLVSVRGCPFYRTERQSAALTEASTGGSGRVHAGGVAVVCRQAGIRGTAPDLDPGAVILAPGRAAA